MSISTPLNRRASMAPRRRFVNALLQAGTVLQAERRAIWATDTPIRYESQDAVITLHPAENLELRVSYLLDYGHDSPIPWQVCTQTITPGDFAIAVGRVPDLRYR